MKTWHRITRKQPDKGEIVWVKYEGNEYLGFRTENLPKYAVPQNRHWNFVVVDKNTKEGFFYSNAIVEWAKVKELNDVR